MVSVSEFKVIRASYIFFLGGICGSDRSVNNIFLDAVVVHWAFVTILAVALVGVPFITVQNLLVMTGDYRLKISCNAIAKLDGVPIESSTEPCVSKTFVNNLQELLPDVSADLDGPWRSAHVTLRFLFFFNILLAFASRSTSLFSYDRLDSFSL